jgi:hypothetical protein
MNQLQAVALNEGYRWKKRLFSEQGRAQLEKLMLPPWASRRLKELLELLTSPQQLPRATFTSHAQALHEHLPTEQVVNVMKHEILLDSLLESYSCRGRVAQLGEHLFCKHAFI